MCSTVFLFFFFFFSQRIISRAAALEGSFAKLDIFRCGTVLDKGDSPFEVTVQYY